MIDFIKGKVASKNPTLCVIESGGIGFEIHITISAFEKLPKLDCETTVIAYLHVKENPAGFVLYGFADSNEREYFKHIISVSGIGPKTAMSILSSINYIELVEYVTSGNYHPLTSVPGVGKKTAERLAVELRDKFAKSASASSFSNLPEDKYKAMNKLSEAMNALISLGYSRMDADKMLSRISSDSKFNEMAIEDIVREALKS